VQSGLKSVLASTRSTAKGRIRSSRHWTGLVAKLIQLFGLLDANNALEGGKRAVFAVK
jgi:hypothetical protein